MLSTEFDFAMLGLAPPPPDPTPAAVDVEGTTDMDLTIDDGPEEEEEAAALSLMEESVLLAELNRDLPENQALEPAPPSADLSWARLS